MSKKDDDKDIDIIPEEDDFDFSSDGDIDGPSATAPEEEEITLIDPNEIKGGPVEKKLGIKYPTHDLPYMTLENLDHLQKSMITAVNETNGRLVLRHLPKGIIKDGKDAASAIISFQYYTGITAYITGHDKNPS